MTAAMKATGEQLIALSDIVQLGTDGEDVLDAIEERKSPCTENESAERHSLTNIRLIYLVGRKSLLLEKVVCSSRVRF